MDSQNQSSRRESRRWPFALIGTVGGVLLGVLIVLAARGPSVVVVNNDNCCCQCGQRCTDKPSPGAPRTSDRVPALPTPEYKKIDPGPVKVPEPKPKGEAYGNHVPYYPYPYEYHGGGGKRNEQDAPVDHASVPISGSVALLAAGLLAWRLS